jgi:NAD dependent epimerase/dehydratase family
VTPERDPRTRVTRELSSMVPAPQASHPVTWVIGAQGLLGSAVCRDLVRRGRPVICHAIAWDDPPEAISALGKAARSLLARHASWRIAWCAGAGVVGTSKLLLEQEIEVLRGFLAELGAALPTNAATPSTPRTAQNLSPVASTARTAQNLSPVVSTPGMTPNPSAAASIPGTSVAGGALFVASSAGGIYAGSAQPPFSEQTPARPISPYGHAKLATEWLAADFSERTGVPVLIGRIANLYGPGQNVDKPQGLVSQLCRAHLTRTPVSIYVPLDTARDYLYVDDAARVIVDGLERVREEGGRKIKIIASGRTTSVAAIIAELGRVTKRRPQIVLGASPNARYQARDLRLRSAVWPDLDRGARTTLAAGISATLESVGQDARRGRFAQR